MGGDLTVASNASGSRFGSVLVEGSAAAAFGADAAPAQAAPGRTLNILCARTIPTAALLNTILTELGHHADFA
jgi:hypothetical protein